jgi:formate--tetrahydrofolate ligase
VVAPAFWYAILGLPGESRDDMLATARELARVNIDAVKIHNLYCVKNTALAEQVAALCDSGSAQFRTLYQDDLSLWEKTQRIARKIYSADDIIADKKIRDEFARFEAAGYGHYPICMAKTQYSFSTDPNLLGAPSGHVVPIREVRLAAGAEFIVGVCGAVMTMPGLPRVPAANNIRVNSDERIEGLF